MNLDGVSALISMLYWYAGIVVVVIFALWYTVIYEDDEEQIDETERPEDRPSEQARSAELRAGKSEGGADQRRK